MRLPLQAFIATIYLAAGVGCIAFAVNFRINNENLLSLFALFGGVCGLLAAILTFFS